MRIAIMGSSSCFDSDICVIHGLQKKGIKLLYFFRMKGLANPLFRLENNYPYGIIPASGIKEMQMYNNYIDLNDLFMISAPGLRYRSPRLLWLYLKVMWRIKKYNPDLIHHSWPWTRTPAIVYFLRKKKTMFVHDPLPHSSHDDMVQEKYRRIGFKKADKLILLNNKTIAEFCTRYSIPESKIALSHLCVFDYLEQIPYINPNVKEKYILFFGQIASYKGVDLLLRAMKTVHIKHPDWKLIVAGGGSMYFDISEYEQLNYIEIRNYFIDMPELIGLIKSCEFVVAPYRDATQSGILNNALSLSKPVIVTNVGNFADEVENGITGVVIPPNNIDALCGSINRMIESPEMRNQMSNEIKTAWRNENNNDIIINKLIDIFKSVSLMR